MATNWCLAWTLHTKDNEPRKGEQPNTDAGLAVTTEL